MIISSEPTWPGLTWDVPLHDMAKTSLLTAADRPHNPGRTGGDIDFSDYLRRERLILFGSGRKAPAVAYRPPTEGARHATPPSTRSGSVGAEVWWRGGGAGDKRQATRGPARERLGANRRLLMLERPSGLKLPWLHWIATPTRRRSRWRREAA